MNRESIPGEVVVKTVVPGTKNRPYTTYAVCPACETLFVNCVADSIICTCQVRYSRDSRDWAQEPAWTLEDYRALRHIEWRREHLIRGERITIPVKFGPVYVCDPP